MGQAGGPRLVEWEELAGSEPYPGVTARRFDAEHASVIRYELAPGASYPIHSHPEEQLVLLLAGEVEFHAAGAAVTLREGDLYHVPGHVPHGARATGSGTAVFLNIVAPRRRG